MRNNRGNPFTPNFGVMPPYLAGRESAQDKIAAILTSVAEGGAKYGDLVIVGPRGTGKTALLQWAAASANRKRGVFFRRKNPRIVLALPKTLKREEDVFGLFLNRKSFTVNSIEAGVRGARANWAATGVSLNDLFQRTAEHCRRHPTIVLIDEAHKLSPECCGLLLETTQAVRLLQGALLLILVGTPGLFDVLVRSRATFHERGDKICLGLLSPAAAADAIRIPLAADGIAIGEDQLGRIVADSQCYPYFLQAWGKALWAEARKHDSSGFRDEQIINASMEAGTIRQGLYENRRDQWQGEDRLFLVELAKTVRLQKTFDREALEEAVGTILARQQRGEADVAAMMEKLVATDFLWKPWGSRRYIPGIPSLVSYVIEARHESGPMIEGVREPFIAGEYAW